MGSIIVTLDVKRFLVCSSGEEVAVADNPLSIREARLLRDEKQINDSNETWSIVAELDE